MSTLEAGSRKQRNLTSARNQETCRLVKLDRQIFFKSDQFLTKHYRGDAADASHVREQAEDFDSNKIQVLSPTPKPPNTNGTPSAWYAFEIHVIHKITNNTNNAHVLLYRVRSRVLELLLIVLLRTCTWSVGPMMIDEASQDSWSFCCGPCDLLRSLSTYL
jgi:hypothetical protein